MSTAVLLLVAVGLSVLAYRVLPSGSSASAPGEFALVDYSPQPLTSLTIWEIRDWGGESVLRIGAAAPTSEDPPAYLSIYLDYPGKDKPTCAPVSLCVQNPGYLPLLVNLPNDDAGTDGEVDYQTTIVFHGPTLGIDGDGSEATSELPAVQVPLTSTAQKFLIGAVEVIDTLPDTSTYDWTTGQRPITAKGNVLTWYLNLQPQDASGSMFDVVSSSAGAVNQAAQQRAQHLTFLSGALIGVAGGAFVGAIQLMLTRREVARDVGDEMKSPALV